jgi:ArsR family transcriptional regulator, arsenate/arsenite/antimonite-responsive transcriptional repressor
VETTQAVAALAALAQDNRLDVFGLLVRAGPQGMSAGHVAEALGLAPKHADVFMLVGCIRQDR